MAEVTSRPLLRRLLVSSVVVTSGIVARVCQAQAAYTITDLGVLPGYEYAIANNAGSRVINNAGQVIFQCVHTVNVGDPVQGILPDVQVVGVRYTPGLGVERLAPGLGQNLISPAHINEQGTVFGNAVQRVWSYSSSGQLVTQRTQPVLWRQSFPAALEILAVPADIPLNFGQVGWQQQINGSGSFIVQTFDTHTGVQGGGAYLADGWHDGTSLDPSLSGVNVTISAINDAGMMVGWIDATPEYAWVYTPGAGLAPLTLPNDYGAGATARLISSGGDIAGDYETPSAPGDSQPFRRHAFVKRAGQAAIDIHNSASGIDSYVGDMHWPYVVGAYFDISFHSVGVFRWNASTGAQELLPPDPYEISSGPVAVNASGQVLGNAQLDIDFFNPWICRSGTQREYLRDLIGDPGEQVWDLKTALDTNDHGQIAVYARRVSDGRASIIVLTPVCAADFDRNGRLEVADIFSFLSAWFASDAAADVNGNGLAVSDIFDFLNTWFAGCR